MQDERFGDWLKRERALKLSTVESRIANCRRVEAFEGDLDAMYDADQLDGTIERLTYSREDARDGRTPKHRVPIDGDIRNGTATYKSAVRLYRHFRSAVGGAVDSTRAPTKQRLPGQPSRPRGAHWPVWPQPNDVALLGLARVMAPFLQFLNPRIVGEVTEDNRRLGAEWSSRLGALGIDPAIYLWEGSPCAFPGVRRYAGSTEIAVFRKRAAPDEPPRQCLKLDDNDYPKHLWAFICTGNQFRKRGPIGYQLAHLFDHKKHGNRWRDELDLPQDMDEPAPLYGLFTSAANSIYAPGVFLKPTDGSPRLRSLIQRRALQLYGDVCSLVPPPLTVRPCDDPDWALHNFRWSEPVGGVDRVRGFLEFRRNRMDELFDQRRSRAG